MRQSDRVELFKKGQQAKFALHSKFHLITGEEVCSTEQYEHLQVGSSYSLNLTLYLYDV